MAKIPNVPITASVLKWAREKSGYTDIDFADEIEIAIETYRAWEQGASRPSYAQLKALSLKLKRPSAFFFLENPPIEPEPPKDFRVLSDVESELSPKTISEIRKARSKRAIALELAEDLEEVPEDFGFRTNMQTDPSKLAVSFRKKVQLTIEMQKEFPNPTASFLFWKRVIESYNVLVFQASLDSLEDMRGLAIFEKKFPIILLNTKDTPNGKTFSLLHEFCHLLLQVSGIGNMAPSNKGDRNHNKIEIFCNKFAAECLMPNEIFLAEISKSQILNDRFVKRFSELFKLSKDVVLRKALDNLLISKNQYEMLIADLKRSYKVKSKGGFKIFHEKIFDYHGPTYTNLVLQGLQNDFITTAQATQYMGAKLEHFVKIGQIEKIRQRR